MDLTLRGLPADTAARLAVVELRQRLEFLAVEAFIGAFQDKDLVCPQDKIKERLSFVLVTHYGKAPMAELLELIRAARHVYTRSSDVLHGRTNMVNLPAVLIEEWEEVVRRLEVISR